MWSAGACSRFAGFQKRRQAAALQRGVVFPWSAGACSRFAGFQKRRQAAALQKARDAVAALPSKLIKPWDPLENPPQSLDGPQVAAAGSGLGETQNLGDLGRAELFKMFERQHLAVDRVHAVQGLLN
jgi:hypothetical protein